MRSSAAVVVAGLAAVAYADPVTVTNTVDVTVTYCAPTVTNCPAKSTWATWQNVPVVKPTGNWADWENVGRPAVPTGIRPSWDGKGKQPANWNDWSNVPSQPSGKRPYWDGKGNKPANWDDWSNVPSKPYGKRPYWDGKGNKPANWDDWEAYTSGSGTRPSWDGKGSQPANWDDWSNVPSKPSKPIGDRPYWDGKGNKPANWDDWEAYSYGTGKPIGDRPYWDGKGNKPANWDDWSNVPSKPSKPISDRPAWDGKGDKPANWDDWANVPANGGNAWNGKTPVVTTWANYNGDSGKTPAATGACPKYTAMGPPEWFKSLPADAYASMSSKWAAGPPADWCYYSYSTIKTSATPVAGETWANVKATTTSSVKWAAYTGAATANSGKVAMAGLAGLAAIIMV